MIILENLSYVWELLQLKTYSSEHPGSPRKKRKGNAMIIKDDCSPPKRIHLSDSLLKHFNGEIIFPNEILPRMPIKKTKVFLASIYFFKFKM